MDTGITLIAGQERGFAVVRVHTQRKGRGHVPSCAD
jgi:hypothetical protein